MHRDAFYNAKDKLINAVPLGIPKFGVPFLLYTDASDVAVGAVLQQEDRPLAFFSRKLTNAEQKYSAFDKEFLAIYLALKNFRYLCEGSSVHVKTDHKPLVCLPNIKEPSKRHWRWLNFLSEFNLSFEHIKGRLNIVSDMLSRHVKVSSLNAIDDASFITSERLKILQKEDISIQALMRKQNQNSLQIKEIEGVLYDTSQGAPRILLPEALRDQEIRRIHNISHSGRKTTIALVAERYVWKGMRSDVAKWVKCCLTCQAHKIGKYTKTQYGRLPSGNRFEVIHMDFVGPLPQSRGYRFLLTIIDRNSNWFEVIPLRQMTVDSMIDKLSEVWISRFGTPKIIITDRGTQFTSQKFKEFTKFVGTELRHTTAYHPQCNGKVERLHRTIKTALKACVEANQGIWTKQLPWILLGLRNATNEELGSAFQRLYGCSARLPGDYTEPTTIVPLHYTPLKQIQDVIRKLPKNSKHYVRDTPYINDDLKSCSHVWILKPTRSGLESVYQGPYKVLQRDLNMKTMIVEMEGVQKKVSIDRIKPAWMWDTRA